MMAGILGSILTPPCPGNHTRYSNSDVVTQGVSVSVCVCVGGVMRTLLPWGRKVMIPKGRGGSSLTLWDHRTRERAEGKAMVAAGQRVGGCMLRAGR